MSQPTHGNSASAVEVIRITEHGVWLLALDRELFMPYSIFPWFQDQPVSAIMNVEEQSPNHFYWPELDIDLTQEIIEHPDRFPKTARSN